MGLEQSSLWENMTYSGKKPDDPDSSWLQGVCLLALLLSVSFGSMFVNCRFLFALTAHSHQRCCGIRCIFSCYWRSYRCQRTIISQFHKTLHILKSHICCFHEECWRIPLWISVSVLNRTTKLKSYCEQICCSARSILALLRTTICQSLMIALNNAK